MSKLLAVLRRRWPLVAITTVVGVLAGAVTAQFSKSEVEQVYTASQVILSNNNVGASFSIAQDELKVTRGAIPERAAELYGTPGEGQRLAGRVGTALDTESGSITIKSNSTDPKEAEKVVQAFTTAFLELRNNALQKDARSELDQTKADLEAAQEQLAVFDRTYPQASEPGALLSTDPTIRTLLDQRGSLTSSVNELSERAKEQELQLSRAKPYESLGPESPRPMSSGLVSVPTSPLSRAILLGAFGLLLGGVVSMVIERMSRRIDTREELVEAIDLPILAEIGFLDEKHRDHDPDGSLLLSGIWAEPYRGVRSAIQFVQSQDASSRESSPGGTSEANGASRPPLVFMVTSASPGEGKSTSVALTAEALAEVGQPTLVVGADFRRPEVDRLLGVERHPSLQDLARLDVDRLEVDDIVQEARFPSLYVAAAGRGTREVTGLIDAAKEVIETGRDRGATVIVDSSPLRAANDTIDLLPVVDYVILVVRSGLTTEAGLTEVIESLRRMDAKILGVILIGTPSAGRQQYYYYDYYSPTDGTPADGSVVNGSQDRPPIAHEPPVAPPLRAPLSGHSALPPASGTHPAPPLPPIPKSNGVSHPGTQPPPFDHQESVSR